MFKYCAHIQIKCLTALFAGLLLQFSLPVQAFPQGDAAKGKKLYEQGVGHNGEPVYAVGQNGLTFQGEDATCLRCHRRSGFGGSEGGYYVPPIAAGFVYRPSRRDRNDRFRAAFLEAQNIQHWVRVRMPRARPAYTTATLAEALREGRNPSGTEFDQLMPRYRLDDRDVANLAAYLATLSKAASPGVDDHFLHIATVVSHGVEPGARDSMLASMQAYVKWYNERLYSDIAHESSARAYGMDVRSSTRLWKLHVWELDGRQEKWRDQLALYQRQQPVFAVVNGMVNGSWAPVADFCDEMELPCLFPLTELPQRERESGGYNFYYTRGLELEADILGVYLKNMRNRPERVIQLHDTSRYGVEPASRLAGQLAARLPEIRIRTIAFDTPQELEMLLRGLGERNEPDVGIVIWGEPDSDSILKALLHSGVKDSPVFVPAHVIRKRMTRNNGDLLSPLLGNLHITWPFSLPQAYQADAFRVRGWMRSRGLPINHEQVQLLSHYGMNVLRDSTRHLFEHYYRDYLVERIEHEVESSQHPGIYPSFSLGPEQRVMSKGGYVLTPDATGENAFNVAADWIVP
ncbi:hypothetical protein SAMN05421690_103412 [Nitrosomonas sp. Nm51]|uniref:c-type cytochrome n=1 Tax=Nitrosomonas sp. Nm51 TaxID=133720 RepID=UPI0008BBCC14|nr:hypothetical protein [Nitrosomonas sp. Nm51]SER52305.1 hypothetical protein SAMN05421690_103412 [Nitrosomonas sp. Nm51]